MMWLIDELGVEAFRAQVVGRMAGAGGRGVERASAAAALVDANWRRRSYLGAHAQKQAGLCFVGIHVPVGRLQAADMLELARLARDYSASAQLRLTVEQNLVLPDVRAERVDALLREPVLEKLSPSPPPLLAGLVACTGSQFCGQAIIETKARALRLAADLDSTIHVPRPVRMHWTGCPNSCAQVQLADIGFMGCMARDSHNRPVEGVDIFLSGSSASDSHLGRRVRSSVPCSDLLPVVQQILIDHFGARRKT
jgi:ferredoxin-nitrite reductase